MHGFRRSRGTLLKRDHGFFRGVETVIGNGQDRGKKVSLIFREDLHNIPIPFTLSSLEHVSTRRQNLAGHFDRTAECHDGFLVPCIRPSNWCSYECDQCHKQNQWREFRSVSHFSSIHFFVMSLQSRNISAPLWFLHAVNPRWLRSRTPSVNEFRPFWGRFCYSCLEARNWKGHQRIETWKLPSCTSLDTISHGINESQSNESTPPVGLRGLESTGGKRWIHSESALWSLQRAVGSCGIGRYFMYRSGSLPDFAVPSEFIQTIFATLVLGGRCARRDPVRQAGGNTRYGCCCADLCRVLVWASAKLDRAGFRREEQSDLDDYWRDVLSDFAGYRGTDGSSRRKL